MNDDHGQPWTYDKGMIRDCDGRILMSFTGGEAIAKVYANFVLECVNRPSNDSNDRGAA